MGDPSCMGERLGISDMSSPKIKLPNMAIFGAAPKITAFIWAMMDRRPEAQGRDFRFLDAELQARIPQVDNKEWLFTHLKVVNLDLVQAAAQMPSERSKACRMVTIGDALLWLEGRRAPISVR